MSLNIDTEQITAVLLADTWHEVSGQSFELDAYEMHTAGDTILSGGEAEGITATGFTFRKPDGTRLYGPLTTVLAVRTGQPSKPKTASYAA